MWTLLESELNKLLIFERKKSIRIFGPCREETQEKEESEKNDKLKRLYQMPDILGEIRKRRLRCVGRSRIGKRKSADTSDSMQCVNGKKTFGTSAEKWEDQVMSDGENWRDLAINREK